MRVSDPFSVFVERSREMTRTRVFGILFLLAANGPGQAQVPKQTIQNLDVLVGKQVIAQRIPLCSPGTFTTVLTFAGKQATVVSLKPSNIAIPSLPQSTMNRLPLETRAMLEDAQKGAVILVKFEDGTTLDTCGPVTPRNWTTFLELVPGQDLGPAVPVAAPVAAPVPPSLPAQKCPVSVVKATSTNGGFRHALVAAAAREPYSGHYLDIRMRNNSQQPVKAIEALAAYSNAMGDEGASQTILSQNDKSIPPGGEYLGYTADVLEQWLNGKGEVTVYVNRVRFEDNTFWQDNGSHSCALTTKIKQ